MIFSLRAAQALLLARTYSTAIRVTITAMVPVPIEGSFFETVKTLFSPDCKSTTSGEKKVDSFWKGAGILISPAAWFSTAITAEFLWMTFRIQLFQAVQLVIFARNQGKRRP